MTTLSTNINSYGNSAPFTIDASSIYTVTAGCPCNNNNSNAQYAGPPVGVVSKIPFDGSAPTNLAEVDGSIGGIAVDAADVYWSTDTTVWKAPLAGGAATTIAGNLTNGRAAYQCNGCGGGQSQLSTSLALGPSSLYVAVDAANESSILEVAK